MCIRDIRGGVRMACEKQNLGSLGHRLTCRSFDSGLSVVLLVRMDPDFEFTAQDRP